MSLNGTLIIENTHNSSSKKSKISDKIVTILVIFKWINKK